MAGANGRLDVFTIVEKKGMEKKLWVKIGAAFVNKDDSLNVYLDALPANGQLHIRKAEKKGGDEARA